MNYEKEIEWLFNQFPSYQTVGGIAYKSGIDTMKEFDRQLGEPHRTYQTVHIAGTNGKGSVSHIMASALAATGRRVGLYTSPHLTDFRERIKVIDRKGFEMIPREDVYDFLLKWKHFFMEQRPSFFEITTGMALDYFAKAQVDVAVIEVGLGGRLDSTNIITPMLSVITNIGLEHTEHLGNTLEKIAFEKGGIIKQGIPAVIGEVLSETRPVFERLAMERCSPLYFAEDSEAFRLQTHYNTTEISYKELDLPGDYQQNNLKTLLTALAVMEKSMYLNSADYKSVLDGVKHAAVRTGLHGRWETLQNEPDKPVIICDTGHNAHGWRWVREQIDRVSCDYDNIFVIFGVVADKDLNAIAHYLPHDVRYIFTNAATPRALPAAKLAGVLTDYGISGIVSSSVKDAIAIAQKKATSKDMIFIGGSNFVVAEALPLFLIV